jgi:RHS repeat-associated protein
MPLPVVVNENGPDGDISYAYGNSLISASATGLQSFYQFDGLGSVTTVTDGAASQKASYIYDPWGSLIGGVDLLGTKNKFRYIGEAADTGAGLVYLRARYYDPSVGRFLSRDVTPGSAGLPMSINRYQYALSNPLSMKDPSGLSSIDGSQSGGEVLGAFTEVSGGFNFLVDPSTAANSVLASAASDTGLSVSGFAVEELKALALYEAARVADATGHPSVAQFIRNIDTLTTPIASSQAVGQASFGVSDAVVPKEVGLLNKIFDFFNSNPLRCYTTINLDVASQCR